MMTKPPRQVSIIPRDARSGAATTVSRYQHEQRSDTFEAELISIDLIFTNAAEMNHHTV